MNRQLSDEEKRILRIIMGSIESRIRNGSLQGGIGAKEVSYTVYYLVKFDNDK